MDDGRGEMDVGVKCSRLRQREEEVRKLRKQRIKREKRKLKIEISVDAAQESAKKLPRLVA
ncbi:MAG: hypothetical protein ACYCVH_16365 [Ignavibacteriaceae bacterium]